VRTLRVVWHGHAQLDNGSASERYSEGDSCDEASNERQGYRCVTSKVSSMRVSFCWVAMLPRQPQELNGTDDEVETRTSEDGKCSRVIAPYIPTLDDY